MMMSGDWDVTRSHILLNSLRMTHSVDDNESNGSYLKKKQQKKNIHSRQIFLQSESTSLVIKKKPLPF